MSEAKGARLFKIASQINIGKDAIVDFLQQKGFKVENKPTTMLTDEMVSVVMDKFSKEARQIEKQREKVEKIKKVTRPGKEHGDERDGEHSEPVKEAETPAAPEPVEVPPVQQEKAPEPEPEVPAMAAPVRQEPEPEPQPREEAPAPAPVEAAEEKPRHQAPAPEPQEPEAQPVPEIKAQEAPAPEPQPREEAPAKPEEVPAEPAAAKADEAADETGADAEAKRKKKRKNVVEVQYEPGKMPQLRGLTVVGKIDIPRPAPPQRRDDRRDDRRGDRGREGGNRDNREFNRDGNRGPRPDARPGDRRPDDRNRPAGDRPPGDRNRPAGDRPPGDRNAPRPGGGFFGGQGGPPRPGFSAQKPAAGGGRPLTQRELDEAERERNKKKRKGSLKPMVNQDDVDKAIRKTLSGMDEGTSVSNRNKLRQKKRVEREERETRRQEELEQDSTILRVTEFVTTGDLAALMNASPAEIISKCFALGLMVTINQRLDKDTISLIADDFGYTVEFLDEQAMQTIEEEEDTDEVLVPRPPIVTIMGHVDHGKTSLLDYIRRANVVAGESGGITQHIGAYKVENADGRAIAFLDTPGHEAFTAMRARGAQVTDIVVLVVAADDSVMPQTIEAISHAQAANVPLIVAINKIDKPDSQPDRIKQQLSGHGILVEDWGGKYQTVELSAKTGLNVDQLLEKILLEADLLELKANPDRRARGAVIEAHVDKGRGNVATIMVQKGTLRIGDTFVAGTFAGRVRAMYDERGHRVEEAGPSTPVQVTGFDGLPEAGDTFVVAANDVEAREIATQRQQLRREQQFRQVRHITLDEISQQIQLGGVKELRLIVKADVSGSAEALTDSLQKLSRDEVKVTILHRGVGAISEGDVMLAAASDAVIVGFHVAPTVAARKIADNEAVDVRLYSIIYDCINEIQLALEGLLSPEVKEETTATVEVRQTFLVSKLGTIAGCYVLSGKISRNDKIRVLRNGFQVFKGTIHNLKRMKDDVREVDTGYECGITLNGFNDFEIGDIIEGYKIVEIKRKFA